MFLKSVEIHGFKSFANKTIFTFQKGISAIVGPNGCGKSNIVDAVRWVLGETNARSLRGEVMEDIIFSGSESRKPLGMAEVGITIVNDEGLLPIEYSEVNVTRRLYRSGESEFFINKSQVRMKDVHELFANTGIGKPAYSIMEQGNIDMILSNKPEERMALFEEAAGIALYRMRIKESYRKLEATNENLLRLNLIIDEVEKEYKNLEKQAEKALLYKKLKEKEVRYEALYTYERVQILKRQVERNNSQLETLRLKREGLEKQSSMLNSSIKNDMQKVRNLEKEIIEIKNSLYRKETELEAIKLKSSHYRDRIHEIENEIDSKNQFMQKIEKNRTELTDQIEQLKKERETLCNLLTSQEEKLHAYLSEIERVDQSLEEVVKHRHSAKAEIEKIDSRVIALRNGLKDVVDRLLKEIDQIKTEYRGNEKKKITLMKEIDGSIVKIEKILKRHSTWINDFAYGFGESRSELMKDINDENEELRELFMRLKLNIETIINLQDDLSRAIFGKESMHTRKEEIEVAIEELVHKERTLKNEIETLDRELRESRAKKEEFMSLVNALHPDIARNKEKRNYYEESIKRIELELEKNDESLMDVGFDVDIFQERRVKLDKSIEELNSQCRDIEKIKLELNEKTKDHNSLIDTVLKDIHQNETRLESATKKIDETSRSIERYELNNAELTSRINTIIENFKENYSISLEIFQPDENIDIQTLNKRREEIKRDIQSLGQVNLLAIEELNEVKKRYGYLSTQKQDLEKAKEDLNELVSRTIKSSKDLFMESFSQIQYNFNTLFRRLFNGGKTDLYLTNEANIFDSGVEIMAYPPGKSPKRRTLLSGGEKGLIAIALLFSIFMVRPSPFCLLDEVDHDLDEGNVIRFVELLKEFTHSTQFIIITHNRRTIEFADVIYGVTTEEAGVSKVVSINLVEHALE